MTAHLFPPVYSVGPTLTPSNVIPIDWRGMHHTKGSNWAQHGKWMNRERDGEKDGRRAGGG